MTVTGYVGSAKQDKRNFFDHSGKGDSCHQGAVSIVFNCIWIPVKFHKHQASGCLASDMQMSDDDEHCRCFVYIWRWKFNHDKFIRKHMPWSDEYAIFEKSFWQTFKHARVNIINGKIQSSVTHSKFSPTWILTIDTPQLTHEGELWGLCPESQVWSMIYFPLLSSCTASSGIILCMRPANERWCYNVTSSLIGWAHSQNYPWSCYIRKHYIETRQVPPLCNTPEHEFLSCRQV